MDEKRIQKIVELRDERNYLENIFEAAEEKESTVEEVMTDRIVDIMKALERLEK